MYIIDTSQETFLKKSCSCHVVVDGAVVSVSYTHLTLPTNSLV